MTTGRLSKFNYTEGDSLSPNELCVRFNITREEIASFQQCIRVYLAGEPIIREGEIDHTLFLVRSGRVDVYKRSSENKQELLGTIEAVNFVGEMAVLNDEPRSATVIATKGEVLVYAITRPNLGLILANPKWAEMLIARLSKNLAQSNEDKVQSARQINDLLRQVEQLQSQLDSEWKLHENFRKNVRKTVATILLFEQAIQDLSVYGSRSWTYLKAFRDVSMALLDRFVPNLEVADEDASLNGLLASLRSLSHQIPGGISTELQEWIEKNRTDH